MRASRALGWLGALVALGGCEGPRSLEPFAVLFDPLARDLALVRDGVVLVRLPGDALRLGGVAALEDARSYDPAYLEALPVDWLTWRETEQTFTDEGIDATLFYDGDVRVDLRIREPGPGRFLVTLRPQPRDDDTPIALYQLGLRTDPDEGFYGLGGVLDTPNHRGHRRAMHLLPDLTVESGNNEAHVPVPLLIGTRGWGVFVEDLHPMVFDVATAQDDAVTITVGTGMDSAEGLRLHLYAADHPLDVTRRFYDTTGDPTLPAPWAYGPLLWRDEHRDQAQVEDDLRTLRALDLPTSGMWIDRPYASGVNTFDFAPADYPDPGAMIALAHDLGVRMALWHTPYADPVEAPVQHDEAVARGYFPPTAPPVFNNWSLPIDFTNPAAIGWWQDWLGAYTTLGIEGYKLDYAEDVVLGLNGGRLPWRFFDGSDERTMHKRYSALYHRTYAETLPVEGGLLLCRAGTFGGQVYASVIWPGDLAATLDVHRATATDGDGASYTSVGGLPAALVYGLSLGPSGYPFYGSDTGGYRHAPPDKETFIRWFQQTALSTVMQVGTNTNDVPWEGGADDGFDQEVLDTYRIYARLHLRLFPYVWSYATRLADDGRPIQRALGLAFPELGIHPTDTYLLGDHLLVAPVVTHGAREREVPFPPGTWVDWWTGARFEGPTVRDVPAPLGTLPLYLAAGGLVPMLRPSADTLAPAPDPDVDSWADDPGVLHVRWSPGPASAFDVHDGGRLTQLALGERATLQFTQGDLYRDGLLVEAIGVGRPALVEVDDAAWPEVDDPSEAPGWAWTDAMGGTLRVRLPAGDHLLRVRR